MRFRVLGFRVQGLGLGAASLPVTVYIVYMSHNLNSLKGVIWGIIYGTTIGLIKGDTRSLDYSSYHKYYLFQGSY